MEYKNIIDLSRSYWDEENFRNDVERVRKLFVDLVANVNDQYEVRVSEVGYCLQVFENLKDSEIVDERKRQQ